MALHARDGLKLYGELFIEIKTGNFSRETHINGSNMNRAVMERMCVWHIITRIVLQISPTGACPVVCRRVRPQNISIRFLRKDPAAQTTDRLQSKMHVHFSKSPLTYSNPASLPVPVHLSAELFDTGAIFQGAGGFFEGKCMSICWVKRGRGSSYFCLVLFSSKWRSGQILEVLQYQAHPWQERCKHSASHPVAKISLISKCSYRARIRY